MMQQTRKRVFSRRFWLAAAERAVRTVAQTALATLGAAVTFWQVDWLNVAGVSVLAGVLSLLTSVSIGIPEGDDD